MNKLRVLDLFSGIGGFALGLERAGMEVAAFCEIDPFCRAVLRKHWPDVPIYGDIRELNVDELPAVDLICGGDPCPIRSRARGNGKSKHPDLSGYFLAVVGRLRPRWVVRENVPAPDDVHFEAALDALGYRSVIIRADAAAFTGQSRQRDFIVGSLEASWPGKAMQLPFFENGPGSYTTRLGTRQVIPCFTTHRTRYDSRDCYIWEPGRGLRILDGDEREAFAGFPAGWLAGFSEAAIARMCGNAVVPQIVEVIGYAILEAERMMVLSQAETAKI